MKTKIKNFFCLILIFILTLNYSSVFSATSSSWNALENFTKKQYDLLFESNLSNISWEYWDIFEMNQKAESLTKLWESIQRTRENMEAENVLVLNQLKDLEESKKKIDEEIANIIKKIQELSLLSTQLKLEIDENEKSIEELKTKIDENKKILLNYLDYLYKRWNTAYSWEKIDNLKSIILNNEDISTVINDLYFNWIIQIAWKKLIEKYMNLVKELYIKKVELQNKKVEYAKLRKELIVEQQNEKQKREFKERLIEITKNRQQEYEKIIAEKLETETKVKELALSQIEKIQELKNKILSENWCTFVDFSIESKEKNDLEKTNKKCFNLNKIIFLESQLANNSTVTETLNPLIWPVNPIRWLSAYYKDPEYKKTLWAEHYALDIRANQWTDLKAAMEWYVIYINPPTTKDYSYLAIKHPNWFTTVYWHLSQIDVSLYQYVDAWEIIWKTWGEYWTNWAWYLSTWPHLHFEVFKNKEYIDPLDVLDISYLPYTNLPISPAKYRLKYLTDFKARKWYEYSEIAKNSKIFTLKWNTEIERQKYLISTYASWSFNNWQLWVDKSLAWNIDPSVVMCIWLAESWLWRNLTTWYNVWNVWNNDRWDRVVFWSAGDWINAIVRALNNRYLWKINRLDLLSGAGRLTSWLPSCRDAWQSCYATDTKNWHPNMITCLSHLKWEILNDDYNFRIVK